MRMRRIALVVLALIAAGGTAGAQQRAWHPANPAQIEAARREVALHTSPALTRFASDGEFRRYLGALLALHRARSGYYAQAGNIQFAQAATQAEVQSDTVQPICPPEDPMCTAPPGDDAANVIVTGSRIPVANRSVSAVKAAVTNGQITNNQMRNVEEGDIVKQINQFLLVLQDGRLFVVDTGGGGNRRLVLADRTNVYRDRGETMWYDEMLVFGDRVLVTGYSYRQRATELSIFRLDTATGRLGREGVFYISSNDYYSSSNYATRLIGDNLVIYTPFEAADMAQNSFRWPVARRWIEGEPSDQSSRRGRPLFDATSIYRPVRDLEDPTVHTVSVCPLGPAGSGRDLECRTTAFVGPDSSQWYVTQDDAFLWTADRSTYSYDSQACDLPRGGDGDFEPALVYRVPVAGAPIGVVAARGVPPDQFSLQATDGHLFALLKDRQLYCSQERRRGARLAFLDLALSSFGRAVSDVARERYTALPGVNSYYVANRFTDRYLVYGTLGQYRRGLPQHSVSPVYVLPVAAPGTVRPLDVRHTVVRAEQAGNDIVLTGYRDREGLFVTLIDLDRWPRIASSVRLDGRFESEGRSHAFNSLIEADGSGVIGLPTIGIVTRSSRAAWRSSASDLSFLRIDGRGRLSPLGELERRFDYGSDAEDDEDGIPGYSCEVSCIDWYGNSRPIFTDGRIFALTGTELIEGRIYAGEIHELQRLNIALPPVSRVAQDARAPGSASLP